VHDRDAGRGHDRHATRGRRPRARASRARRPDRRLPRSTAPRRRPRRRRGGDRSLGGRPPRLVTNSVPAMTDPPTRDATAQAELARSGEAQPIELVDAAIARIEALNDDVNAVIHPLFERARAAAQGPLPDGPFRGVPIVVKDLDGTLAGAPYHGGNKLLKEIDYTPETSSYIFTKLEAAGFVIVGKANTPEFGLIPSTEPLLYGPTHNP